MFIHLALTVVGPFLGIFLTAVIFSGEYGWGTMRALLARGNPRQHVAVAKMLVIGVILALVWLVSWGFGGYCRSIRRRTRRSQSVVL